MFPRVLEAGCILVGLQIGVDEFDKSVQVLGCDLQGVSNLWVRSVVGRAYSIVLLVEVIDIAVQNLNEELDRDCSVHARIGDAESTLQALEHTLPIAVELLVLAVIEYE